MKNKVFMPQELREELIEFARAYNYFSSGNLEKVIANWIEINDIEAIYFYLHPSPEDENLHLSCTMLANMELNDVITLHQNTRKRVELLKKKERLFEAISSLRLQMN